MDYLTSLPEWSDSTRFSRDETVRLLLVLHELVKTFTTCEKTEKETVYTICSTPTLAIKHLLARMDTTVIILYISVFLNELNRSTADDSADVSDQAELNGAIVDHLGDLSPETVRLYNYEMLPVDLDNMPVAEYKELKKYGLVPNSWFPYIEKNL